MRFLKNVLSAAALVAGSLLSLVSLVSPVPGAVIPATRLPASGWAGKVGIPGGIPTNYTQYCNVLVSVPVPAWTADEPYYYNYGNLVVDPTNQGVYSCIRNGYHSTLQPHVDLTGWTLTQYNTTTNPVRALGNGVTDDTNALNCAIQNCPNNEYVYVPTGTYRITAPLTRTGGNLAPYSFEIKGDGPAYTKILNYGPGNAIQLAPYSGWNSRSMQIVSGDTRGSTSLVLNSIQWGISPGLYMVVNRLNASATIQADASYMVNTASQIVKVASVVGNTVTFTPALNEAFTGDYVTVGINPAFRCGIQDLYLQDMSDNGANNILIEYGQECWIKNVESDNVSRWHFELEACAACEVRECFLHDGWSAGGNADYGVALFQFCSNNLVENNRFLRCRHAMEMEYGGQGNVFGYNYDSDPVNSDLGAGLASELTTDYLMGDQTTHGGSMRWNLFEGNVAATIKFDCVLGSSFYNTVFRCQIQRKGLPTTTVANFGSDVQKWNYYENLSGNVYETQPRGQTWPLRRWGTNQDATTTSWTIANASNTNPIVVTVNANGNGFGTGDLVTITGVRGNTAANVTNASVTVIDATHFSINAAGNGAYAGGGSVVVGVDADSQGTALVDGEYDATTNTTVWAGADHTLPTSYYLTAKPAWFGTLAWPAVDPNHPLLAGTASVPAGYLAQNGVPPSTPPYIASQPVNTTTTVGGKTTFTTVANGYPNPIIQWQVSTNGGLSWNPIVLGAGSPYSVVTSTPGRGPSLVATVSTLTIAATPATYTSYLYRSEATGLSSGGSGAAGMVAPTISASALLTVTSGL